MNEIEIHFAKNGNTIVGSYTEYRELDKAMIAKSVFLPEGHCVKGQLSDFRRLTEYVQLFGHCIKTMSAFQNACNLAGIAFERTAV